MVETSYPFGSSDVATELEWSRMARTWQLDGVVGDDPTSTGLRVTVAGSNINIAAGEAWINGFYYKNSATKTIAITTNAGSTTRFDRVWVRSDQSGNVVTAEYETGGSSPPAASLDEAGIYEMPLARFGVGAGTNSLSSGTLIDERYFIGKPVIVQNSTARRPAKRGQIAIEGTPSAPIIMVANGTGWQQVYPLVRPAWNALSPAPGVQNYGGAYAPIGWARFPGDLIVLRGLLTATQSRPDGARITTLPVGARPGMNQIFTGDNSTGARPRVDVSTDGDINLGPFDLPNGGYVSLSGITFMAEN